MAAVIESSRKTGQQLFVELLAETKAQQREDGDFHTPEDSEGRRERDAKLTEKWRGTAIAARVIGYGESDITYEGVCDAYPESQDLSRIEFPCASGVVEEVSAAHGGFIYLTNGTEIGLQYKGEAGKTPEGWQSGLDIQVVQENVEQR